MNGRPPTGHTLGDALREALTRDEWARLVSEAARQGDIQALKLYADRTEGQAPQSLTVRGDPIEDLVREIAADLRNGREPH